MKNTFWWTVELGLVPGANPAWDEECLSAMASLSGAIGARVLEEDGKLILRADYRSSRDPEALWQELKALAGEEITVGRPSRTEDQDWSTQHLDAFPPLDVGRSLTVMAPWHKDKARQSGRIPIYVFPASAFGTGYHESTQIALELLEDAVRPGDTIIDVGTGSGILFIAALKLGAGQAIARDLDPAVLDEVRRNMELNGLPPDCCDLAVGDLLNGVDAQADILTANILLPPNLALLQDVGRVLKQDGYAIFSGMTRKERETFLPGLEAAGLAPERELERGDWWGCRARKMEAHCLCPAG